MKLTIDVSEARLIRHDEIINHDGGVQVVPAGEVVVTLADGTQLGLNRTHFEEMFSLNYDPSTGTYTDKKVKDEDDEEPAPKKAAAKK